MTPNDIEILIHCHVSPTKHPRYEHNKGVFQYFLDNDLVTKEPDDCYFTTDKGAHHVAQLCQLPLPSVRFIGYDNKPIEL